MALDAAMLNCVANDLKNRIIGARVDKIAMPARDEALFSMRTENGPLKLLISARSGAARAHLTSDAPDNPATPPGFCMLLRKYLSTGRVASVATVEGERIMLIVFDAMSETGERVRLTLSVEVMGRYSNMVLVNKDNRVIDALKRIDYDHSDKRVLLPGVEFIMPPKQDKLPFLTCPAEAMAVAACAEAKPLSAALLSRIAGIGPVVCREIAWRLDRNDPDADKLTDKQKSELVSLLEYVRSAADGRDARYSIVYDEDKPIEFSFIELTQYEGLRAQRYDDPGALFDAYYMEKDRAERMRTRSSDLQKRVNSLCERARRKLASRRDELAATDKAEGKRLFGELVNANLHSIKKGDRSAKLLNYYTGETVAVPLDEAKTPVENAQKYFKDYKKLVTAKKMLAQLIADGEQEVRYLDTVRYEITEARSEDDFLLIRKELKDAGYLKGFKYKEQKRIRRTSEFTEYETSGGFRVLVGRNNASNEKLTLKTADNRDMWFHVKSASGSHTVLVTNGGTPSDADLTEAAEIAAYHSSDRGADNVAVDYTPIRNVRKGAGQKTGMVIYDSYKTAYVTPDADKLERLKKRAEK